MTDQIVIWCDGACSGNPGPGGFASVVVNGEESVVISGSEKHTTNNRMELLGLIAGLGYVAEEIKLYPSTKILVYTDSKYIENSINCKWLDKWVKKGWNNIKIKNVDLWIQVYKLLKLLNPEIQWVKGHSGVPGNELVDKFATIAKDNNYGKQVIMSF